MAPTFVTTAVDEGDWRASRHYGFTTGDIALGTHCIGSWVDHRGGLDTGEEKNTPPCRLSNRGCSAHSYTDRVNPIVWSQSG
jgi:hypothetical protein